jgi:hypothetical protein
MIRPIDEIVESFYYIYKKNDKLNYLNQNLFEKPNPLLFPFEGLLQAIKFHKEHLLLLTYKDLIENPEDLLYDIGLEPDYIFDLI